MWTAINYVFRAINAHEVYWLKKNKHLMMMMLTYMNNITENSTMPLQALSYGIAARSEIFNEV